jgi:hypothetical protein
MVVHVSSRRQTTLVFLAINIVKIKFHNKIENEFLMNFLMVYIERDLLP